MRSTLGTGFAFGALIAVVGCSSILGISDRSLEWCLQPGNAHDFCEDFDHSDPTGAWSLAPTPVNGASRTFVPSDFDPPNAQAMDTVVGPLATGVSNSAGLQEAFVTETFNRVTVGVDMRIVQVNPEQDQLAGVGTGAGFLLVSDIASTSTAGPSECIGLVLAPTTAQDQVAIDVLLVPNSRDCLTVDNAQDDSGTSPMGEPSDADAAAAAPVPTAPVPSPLANVFKDQWFHLTLMVTRAADGSGTIDFRVPSGSSMAPPAIPAGSLIAGFPGVSIGTDITGPSGTFELQFDNVTVDFPASN